MIALAIVPASVSAQEPLIPPGNSAVNQYTESFPTPGGEKKVDEGKDRSPAKSLGTRRTRELERLGRDGRAAAEAAAATAPLAALPSSADAEDVNGTGGSTDTGGPRGDDQRGRTVSGPSPERDLSAEVAGSSGFAEVLSQATGAADSDKLGWWLPLAILAILAAAARFAFDRRRRAGP